MKPVLSGCLMAIALSLCIFSSPLAVFLIVGKWSNCLPDTLEYPCPSDAEAWRFSLVTVSAAIILNFLGLMAYRHLRKRDDEYERHDAG